MQIPVFDVLGFFNNLFNNNVSAFCGVEEQACIKKSISFHL